MYTLIVKKFMGLLAVYIVIIVGIFVAQFKWPAPTFVPKKIIAKERTQQQSGRNSTRTASASRLRGASRLSAKSRNGARGGAAAINRTPFSFSAMTRTGDEGGIDRLPDAITALSSSELYDKTRQQVDDALIAAFTAASLEDIAEEDAASFVAASARTMNLNDAIARVPPQVRHASYRTYLTAPYFGSLTSTYRSLEAQLSNCRDTLAAVKNGNISAMDAISTERMTDYILLNPSAPNVAGALRALIDGGSSAASSSLSVEEATRILLLYNALHEATASTLSASSTLSPAIISLEDIVKAIVPKCFSTIEQHITTDNDTLSVTDVENDVSAIRTGASLVKAGEAMGNEDAAATGRALVNAYITSKQSAAGASGAAGFALYELSELEVLLLSPPHYPHLVPLDDGVYAFTCVDSIAYKSAGDASNNSDINLDITANETNTHYMILGGIKPFNAIYIYNTLYHADQRFETYNTSGFVYVPATNTLLLKSRHKMPSETVRLTYGAPPASAPASAAASAPIAEQGLPRQGGQ